MPRRSGLTAVLAVAAIMFTSCGGTDSPTATQTSQSPSPSPSTSAAECKGLDAIPPEPAPTDADADGRHAAFVISADPNKGTVTYDVVQFLTGKPAEDAYQKDTGEKGGPPNDYYIVNSNSRLRTLKVSADACIAIFRTGDPESSETLPDLGKLAEILSKQKDGRPPYWVIRKSDTITAIQQQWVP